MKRSGKCIATLLAFAEEIFTRDKQGKDDPMPEIFSPLQYADTDHNAATCSPSAKDFNEVVAPSSLDTGALPLLLACLLRLIHWLR